MRTLLAPALLFAATVALSSLPALAIELPAPLGSVEEQWNTRRDLSDQASFRGFTPCFRNGNLFGSWYSLDNFDSQALTAFLAKPALTLTPEEREIVRGHERDLPESAWWELWWTRSCDAFRETDDRHRLFVALKLHFAGEDGPEDLVWRPRMRALYVQEAIARLQAALAAPWPSATEKRVFAYLHAELLRQAGRRTDAKAAFAEVIAGEKKQEPNKDLEWIARWAAEQSLLNDSAAMTAEELAACLLPGMPAPGDDTEPDPPGWAKHRIALTELADRARRKDSAAAEVLWKAFDRKPERLEAMARTLNDPSENGYGFRRGGSKWQEWYDELRKDGQTSGDGFLLLHDDQASPEWRREVMAPAVAKALETGGLLEGENLTSHWAYNRLSWFMRHRPPGERLDIMRLIIRTLKQCPDDVHFPCDSEFYIERLAAVRDEGDVLKKELEGEWKSDFLKIFCSYLAEVPGSAQALDRHPLVVADQKNFGCLTFRGFTDKLLLARRDPLAKDLAPSAPTAEEWIKSIPLK